MKGETIDDIISVDDEVESNEILEQNVLNVANNDPTHLDPSTQYTNVPINDNQPKKQLKPYMNEPEELHTRNIGNKDNETPAEDEFEVYGKYVATQLKNMDILRAIDTQRQINEILTNARIEDIEEKRRVQHGYTSYYPPNT